MKITFHVPKNTPVYVIHQAAADLGCNLELDGDGLVGHPRSAEQHGNANRIHVPARRQVPARPLQEIERWQR